MQIALRCDVWRHVVIESIFMRDSSDTRSSSAALKGSTRYELYEYYIYRERYGGRWFWCSARGYQVFCINGVRNEMVRRCVELTHCVDLVRTAIFI